MLDDAILIWKLRSGSKEAFRLIYEQYARDLLTLAASLLGCPAGAEDVVQDVFTQWVQAPGRFRRPGNLRAWLSTCVANRCRDLQRKDHSLRHTAVQSLEHRVNRQVDSPVRMVIQDEDIRRVSRALNTLPYEQRETLVLRVQGNLTFRQIARLQKVSPKTSQSRYHYGMDKLRCLLDEEVNA
ncbi:MAG: sigma-70 family RNA polymerase sigma factor [Phycisphaerae bacterium]|nr:sigma-70 family RNA polymerase sigma factor [Phycisphaerae bacterium]